MRMRAIRMAMAGAAMIGLSTMSLTAAKAQSADDPHGCSQYAFVSCGYDENGQPIEVTYQCYQERYDACMAFYGGTAALEPVRTYKPA